MNEPPERGSWGIRFEAVDVAGTGKEIVIKPTVPIPMVVGRPLAV
jgi:hypothetical protein